jgi:hypothetical protein
MMFRIELVWNREFNFTPHGHAHPDIDSAIRYAKELENMGDGAVVKKTRVVNQDGKVIWKDGKKVK